MLGPCGSELARYAAGAHSIILRGGAAASLQTVASVGVRLPPPGGVCRIGCEAKQ